MTNEDELPEVEGIEIPDDASSINPNEHKEWTRDECRINTMNLLMDMVTSGIDFDGQCLTAFTGALFKHDLSHERNHELTLEYAMKLDMLRKRVLFGHRLMSLAETDQYMTHVKKLLLGVLDKE